MKLAIHKQVATTVPSKALGELFALVAAGEARKKWQGIVNLVFIGDRQIRDLNREFRGKDKATDVLSFNVEEPVAADVVFGELYISAPTAKRQAEEYGGTLREEYLRLVCHGLLHLFGYDHMKAVDEKKMKKREEKYLSALFGRGK